MDICKICEYENAAFMPCNACDNGSEFRFKGCRDSKIVLENIPDSDDIAKQADAYVRDHLLIQYMMWKFGKACMLDIEDIYDEWIKWLEEKE